MTSAYFFISDAKRYSPDLLYSLYNIMTRHTAQMNIRTYAIIIKEPYGVFMAVMAWMMPKTTTAITATLIAKRCRSFLILSLISIFFYIVKIVYFHY